MGKRFLVLNQLNRIYPALGPWKYNSSTKQWDGGGGIHLVMDIDPNTGQPYFSFTFDDPSFAKIPCSVMYVTGCLQNTNI